MWLTVTRGPIVYEPVPVLVGSPRPNFRRARAGRARHCANLGAYEELLAEFSAIETPFTASPPYIQLLVLVTFNTAIFLGSALIQKAFQVDILPMVCSMTGAGPLEPGRPAAAAAKPAAPASEAAASTFAAFTRNFSAATP